MGTSWSARIANAPEGSGQAMEEALSLVIAQMSNWENFSDISRFNRAAVGEWVSLPPEMMTVLRAGLDIARVSGGAFDPAVGNAVQHWGFGPGASGSPFLPLPSSPWAAIELADGRARRMADVALDFSGIAKGFAVDQLAQTLRDLGARHFLVEIGGELRGDGVRPDGQPWWVDVEPPPGLTVPMLRVALCGLAVATSGDYRRFRLEGDRRLSHSIDPATGAPVSNAVASVTVLHQSAMLADAWATAITVLGPDRGMRLATQHGLAARLVERRGDAGREYVTPALAVMLD